MSAANASTASASDTSSTRPSTSPYSESSATVRVERGLLHVGDHEPHALVEERVAQPLADAARAAGDDCDFSLEVLHRRSLWAGHRDKLDDGLGPLVGPGDGGSADG